MSISTLLTIINSCATPFLFSGIVQSGYFCSWYQIGSEPGHFVIEGLLKPSHAESMQQSGRLLVFLRIARTVGKKSKPIHLNIVDMNRTSLGQVVDTGISWGILPWSRNIHPCKLRSIQPALFRCPHHATNIRDCEGKG
ncbi:hypothetical protein GGR57DRAFT_206213 [Xylariaceae sp. FL1272]|nr:hypothetical protein GGR57DRAFT_206213 [Xylariaceae sp. FL1272]